MAEHKMLLKFKAKNRLTGLYFGYKEINGEAPRLTAMYAGFFFKANDPQVKLLSSPEALMVNRTYKNTVLVPIVL